MRLFGKGDNVGIVLKKIGNVAFIVECLMMLIAILSFAIGLDIANLAPSGVAVTGGVSLFCFFFCKCDVAA
jgi:hypothetical protein